MNDSIPNIVTENIVNVAPDTTVRVVAPPVRIIPRVQTLSYTDSAFMGYFPVSENHLFTVDVDRVKDDLRQTKYQKAEPDSSSYLIEEVLPQTSTIDLVSTPRGETVLQAQSSWIMSVILLLMILYAFVRMRSNAYFNGLFTMLASSIDYRQTTQYIERQGRSDNLVVTFISFFVIQLMAYQIVASQINDIADISGFRLFITLLIVEGAYFLYKIIAYGLIAFAFDSSKIINQIFQLRTLTINLFALIIFPLTVIFLFTSEKYYNTLIIITLALFVLLTVWQLFKSFKIFSINIVTLFYFILYLCAVEILPIVCLTKIFFLVKF